jgi:hypothetical protein
VGDKVCKVYVCVCVCEQASVEKKNMFDIHQTKLTTHIYSHKIITTLQWQSYMRSSLTKKKIKNESIFVQKGFTYTTDELRSIQYPDLGTG